MTSIIIGIIFIGAGSWGILYWFHDFATIVRGLVPLSVFLGGIVALMVGINSLRPRRSDDKKGQ